MLPSIASKFHEAPQRCAPISHSISSPPGLYFIVYLFACANIHKSTCLPGCRVAILKAFSALQWGRSGATTSEDMIEKSQVLSQSICSSCASANVSTNSGDTYQEPLVFLHRQALTKHAHVTSTPTDSTVVSNMPTQGTPSSPQGSVNAFPYGSCTW